MKHPIEPGEYLREEFEKEFGKDKKTGYGEWLDLHRLPHGEYRSMVTAMSWKAFRIGRGVNLNKKDNRTEFELARDNFVKCLNDLPLSEYKLLDASRKNSIPKPYVIQNIHDNFYKSD